MRKLAIISTLIICLIGLLLFGSGMVLANSHPFRPGSLLFPLQDTAEQLRLNLLKDPASQTELYIQLAVQRLSDLGELAGTSRQDTALQAFNTALDRAIQSLGNIKDAEDQFPRLQTLLDSLARKAEQSLSQLGAASQEDPVFFSQLLVKVNTLRRMLEEPDALSKIIGLITPSETASIMVRNPNQPTPTPMGIAIMFPPGSKGAEHAFYELVGQHADLACEACHVDGRYAGTPTQCMDCHHAVKPTSHHYPLQDCVSCHTPLDWAIVDFNHQGSTTTDCQSCHASDRPAGHYNGVCSACHNTSAWLPASFDHSAANAKECLYCHQNARPANHYNGQCSACHSTSGWKPATFNHEAVGATDCISCHDNRKPAGHYAGQCSACHRTSGWKPASFNHEAVGATDCIACHSGNKPSGHYGGQCSACHSTSGWRPASFNHEAVGATDCIACHSGNKPSGHYGGQCSACHSTSGWRSASFNHEAMGATDCIACHSGNRPGNHSDGQCSNCHNTSSWGGASFNHSFPMNHGNAGGECAKCHPSGGSAWTCYTCHDEARMIRKHAEKNISDLSNCLSCHSNGKGGD
jgi:hypothetical protein